MSQLVIHHYAQPVARRHLWIGLAMALVALAFGIGQAAQWLAAHPLAGRGLMASALAGAATGLGALPLLFWRHPRHGGLAPMLGLAGGMMLAASVFSLLVPAAQQLAASGTPWVLGGATAAALLAGAALMQHLDRRTAHTHIDTLAHGRGAPQLGLVVAAIAMHNVPEGLAVGVAAASGVDHGMSLGIALQNIPEGWIVASSLVAVGVGPWRAAGLALGSGLVEPVGGLFGVLASSLAATLVPLALAGAAGAMLWVVGHELIPAARETGRRAAGNAGLVAGFAVMTLLAGTL